MEHKTTDKRFFVLFFTALFAFFCLLSFFMPYTSDDLAWGTEQGMDLLRSGFVNYNGRYLGNLCEIVVTRSHPLRVLGEAFMLTLLVALITALFPRQKKAVAPGSALLILLCPREIFAQAIVWSAGFFNYIPPILVILTYLLILQKRYDHPGRTVGTVTAVVLLGFCGSLFMENMTLVMIMLGVVTVIACRKRRNVRLAAIGWTVAVFAGSAVMFSNGAYHAIAQSSDKYRSIGAGKITTILSNLHTIFSYSVIKTVILNVLLTVLLFLLLHRRLSEFSRRKKTAVFFLGIVAAGCCAYTVLTQLYPSWQVLGSFTPYLSDVTAISYLLCCFVLMLCALPDMRRYIVGLYGTLGAMIAPLVIVNPIGPRNFFVAYLIEILLIALLFGAWRGDRKLPGIAVLPFAATVRRRPVLDKYLRVCL